MYKSEEFLTSYLSHVHHRGRRCLPCGRTGAAVPFCVLMDAAVQRRDVEVDQRALVKKILARYPSAFPPVRELVQNADDAGATEVRLTLEPAALEVDGSPVLQRVSVWNNGRVFTEADWQRIRRIASGNTDEKSIGMFGVGFFTVFALTEAPVIVSGGSRMRFFWEGGEHDHSPDKSSMSGKLITETTACPHVAGASFELLLHEQSDAAGWARSDELLHLRRMLASSLLFTKSIERITLVLTGQPVLLLERALNPLRSAASPLLNAGGPPPLFTLPSKQVELATRTISARWADVPGRPGEAVEASRAATCRMLQVSAAISLQQKPNVHATKQLRSLADKMQKQMPPTSTLCLLYDSTSGGGSGGSGGGSGGSGSGGSGGPSGGASGASGSEHAGLTEMLAFVRCGAAKGEQHGKLYIGLGMTDQTTGGGFHLCGHFLTTMERTNLDFNGAEGFWNRELLAAAGRAARAYFADEERNLSGGTLLGFMGSQVKVKLLTRPPPKSAAPPAAEPPPAEVAEKAKPPEALTPARVQLLCSHTFTRATPNALVGRCLQDAFLTAGGELVIPSTAGPLPAGNVLTVPAALTGALEFVGQLPLVPSNASVLGCTPFYEQLVSRGIIHPLDAPRLCSHLAERSFQAETLGKLLKWFVQARRARTIDDAASVSFMESVLVDISPNSGGGGGGGGGGAVAAGAGPAADRSSGKATRLALASFSHHPLGGVGVEPPLPLPPHTLPLAIARQLTPQQLVDGLGLQPLTFADWWAFTADHPCVEHVLMARLVLAVCARHSADLSAEAKARLLEQLRDRRCIATQRAAAGTAASLDAGGAEIAMRSPGEAYVASPALEQLGLLRLHVAEPMAEVAPGFLEALGLRRQPAVKVVTEGMSTLGWGYKELVRYLLAREKGGELQEEDWAHLHASQSAE